MLFTGWVLYAKESQGFQSSPTRSGRCQGSIPACTGKPQATSDEPLRIQVYPRVYGETPEYARCPSTRPGLSPRVRGNLGDWYFDAPLRRSIPACTGEPASPRSPGSTTQVYPRVYGGTRDGLTHNGLFAGLSPRVRGNRCYQSHTYTRSGSIPACTGEPNSTICAPCSGGVYPACTGEPERPTSQVFSHRVYPRVYGGTRGDRREKMQRKGLSPRVRGNLPFHHLRYSFGGSIPACTGEPCTRFAYYYMNQVYPRVYGGTWLMAVCCVVRNGLSPRVRGNREECSSQSACYGSIPACTGEPHDHTG